MKAAIVLLAAVAAGDPRITDFTLEEQPPDILRRFHEQPHVAVSPAGQVFQFHGRAHSQGCDDGRQWVFFFEPGGRLVSVTRNLESPVKGLSIVPKSSAAKLFVTPDGYPVLRADLPRGRQLVLPGARSLADPVSQVQVMRPGDVARFYPDLRAVR